MRAVASGVVQWCDLHQVVCSGGGDVQPPPPPLSTAEPAGGHHFCLLGKGRVEGKRRRERLFSCSAHVSSSGLTEGAFFLSEA